jgi:hypothetical protein
VLPSGGSSTEPRTGRPGTSLCVRRGADRVFSQGVKTARTPSSRGPGRASKGATVRPCRRLDRPVSQPYQNRHDPCYT